MIDGINKIIILGTVVSEPELKYTNINNPFISLTVSTRSTYKNKINDNMVVKTEWHKVVIFGKTAENASINLKNGSVVYLEGSLRTNKWQDKDGISRYNIDIIANSFKVLDFIDNTNNENLNYENDYNKKSENKIDKSFFDSDINF